MIYPNGAILVTLTVNPDLMLNILETVQDKKRTLWVKKHANVDR